MSRKLVSTLQTYGPINVASDIVSGNINLTVLGKVGFITSTDATMSQITGVIFRVPSQYSTKQNMNYPICFQRKVTQDSFSYSSQYGWFIGSSSSVAVNTKLVGVRMQFALAYPIA